MVVTRIVNEQRLQQQQWQKRRIMKMIQIEQHQLREPMSIIHISRNHLLRLLLLQVISKWVVRTMVQKHRRRRFIIHTDRISKKVTIRLTQQQQQQQHQQQQQQQQGIYTTTGINHPHIRQHQNLQTNLQTNSPTTTTTHEPPTRNGQSEVQNTVTNSNSTSVPTAAAGATAAPAQTVLAKPSKNQQNQQLHPLFTGELPPPLITKNNNKKKSTDLIHRYEFKAGEVPHDETTCKTWIYPQHDDYPTRQYQLEMTETALNYNTLVSLPTGLGKTHIAAVVMYNFYRWFTPKGKVIFLAPTLPLVTQQVSACYKIMGLPAKDTAVMTGRTKAEERREMWKERRVFYATPQTVQNDLQSCLQEAEETGLGIKSEFASQVVCLVLDEAHKASGEHAYMKVIDLLGQAGAKFRILGLSATPGSTIKDIQGVVEAVKAVKIEARTELDPSVAQYLHQKDIEIIIVPLNDHQHDIQRAFNEMLGPLLHRLREEGALNQYGNATVTATSIYMAQQIYQKTMGRNAKGHITSTFFAAFTLASLRAECYQALGSVKTKMLQFMNSNPRGLLSTIVKSDEFKAIFEKVKVATGECDGEGALILDPKLRKLEEILLQHFERAEATGKSSRAIVFAEFRSTVAEIIDSLQRHKPLIRSRYFVGQGKGAKKNKKDDSVPDDDRVKGMKQKEQQKAIRDFHENIFNVLVCTSIGEEGLDIGSVDLIVNYDVTSSPIRTVQRAGRTGRQRDGRVVCLVAEGDEQKKYEKRVQAEKTLHNALKNPKKFKVASHFPMLPEKPTLEYRTMEIQSQLHLSQVAGAQRTPGTAKRGSTKGRSSSTAWQLDAAEEEERQRICGDIVALDDRVEWDSLKKFFWKSRVDPTKDSKAKQALREKLLKERGIHGRCTSILNVMKNHGPINSGGSTRIGCKEIKKIFPVHPTKCNEKEAIQNSNSVNSRIAWGEPYSTEENVKGGTLDSLAVQDSHIANEEVEIPMDEVKRSETNRGATYLNSADSERPNIMQQHIALQDPAPEQQQLPEDGDGEAADEPMFKLPTASSSSSSSSDESDDESDSEPMPQPASFAEPPAVVAVDLEQHDSHIRVLDKDFVHETMIGNVQTNDCNAPHDQVDTRKASAALPKPDSDDDIPLIALKSKCEKKNKKDREAKKTVENDDDVLLISLKKKKNKAATESVESDDDVPLISLKKKTDSTSIEMIESQDDVPLISLKKKNKDGTKRSDKKSPPLETIDTSDKQIASNPTLATARPRKEDLSQQAGGCQNEPINWHYQCPGTGDSQDLIVDRKSASNGLNRRRILESPDDPPSPDSDARDTTERLMNTSKQGVAKSETDSSGRENASNDEYTPLPSRPKPSASLDVLEDTPATSSDGGKQRGRANNQNGFSFDPLTNTPAGEASFDDVVCQVCTSGDITHDQIYLCDACDSGFHQFCYAIPEEEVADSDDPWFCDSCAHHSKGASPLSSFEMICVFCRKQSGALKKSGIGWYHPLCSLFSERLVPEPCSSCFQKRAVKCDDCDKTIHPYCAIESGWTIVHNQTDSVASSIFCPDHSHKAIQSEGVRVIRNGKADGGVEARGKKIVKKKTAFAKCNADSPISLAESVDEKANINEAEAKKAKLKRRRDVLARFALEEAEIGSDQDPDGDDAEEEELRRLEDQEALSQDSFINDNAVLTQHFSEDELGDVDPDAAEADIDYTHRALNAQRDRDNQYKTPNFNRRMMRRAEDSADVPSSQRGLGRMHFIRSVLEHHRQGGDCEEIEQCYKQMARDETPLSETAETEWANAAANPSMYNNNDSIPATNATATAAAGRDVPDVPPQRPSTLTAEQQARIEANRQEALRRRAMLQARGNP